MGLTNSTYQVSTILFFKFKKKAVTYWRTNRDHFNDTFDIMKPSKIRILGQIPWRCLPRASVPPPQEQSRLRDGFQCPSTPGYPHHMDSILPPNCYLALGFWKKTGIFLKNKPKILCKNQLAFVFEWMKYSFNFTGNTFHVKKIFRLFFNFFLPLGT